MADKPSAKPRRRSRRWLKRFTLMVCLPLVAVGAAVYLYVSGGRYVTTENAYVKANIVAVSADVSGRVVDVQVRDNELVKPGQLVDLAGLVELPQLLALAGAELASLDAADQVTVIVVPRG